MVRSEQRQELITNPGVQYPHCGLIAGDEGLLQLSEFAVLRHPFHCLTSCPARRRRVPCRRNRRPSSHTVHAPQVARSQTFLRPCEWQLIAKRLEQRHPRFDIQGILLAIDRELDGHRAGTRTFSPFIFCNSLRHGIGIRRAPCQPLRLRPLKKLRHETNLKRGVRRHAV